METRPKTIIIDLDGVLLHHFGSLDQQALQKPVVLPGAVEKLREWDRRGYKIVLLTGRRQSMRRITEKQLRDCGLFYDTLVMGVGGGVRVLINDLKEGSDEPTALAVNVPRNKGIIDVEV